AGYRAVLARDPEDAAACIRRHLPCLVLLDLAMVGTSERRAASAASEPSRPARPSGQARATWSGWDDLYQRLRRETAAPLIALGNRQPPAGSAGQDAALDGIAALDLGADDYMTTPLNPLEFAARARAILRRRNASRRFVAPAQ